RPQTMSKAMQPKMATGAGNRTPPVAPPVYRPQIARVLQAKSSSSPNSRNQPQIANRVAHPFPKTGVASRVIQRSEESKNLQNLGKVWSQIADMPKESAEKKEFAGHSAELKEKLGFTVSRGFQVYDPVVRGGKNKNYNKIVAALQGADAGKTSADL